MSLILDALKKIEQERKARSGGKIDIRPEVLDRRAEAPRPARKRFPAVIAGLLVLAVAVGTGFLLKRGKPAKPSEPSPTATVTVPSPPAAPPAPVQPPAPVRQTATAQPTAPAQPAPVKPPVAVKAPPQPAPDDEAEPAPAPPPRAMRGSSTEEPSPPMPQSSDLVVSGIAWQDERKMRRAVVNGLLVGEGAEIAGARIVEIGERRVKFSRGGQTFSLSLSSPLPGR